MYFCLVSCLHQLPCHFCFTIQTYEILLLFSFLLFLSLLYPNSFVSYRLKSETNIISLYTIWWWYKVIKNGLKNKNKKKVMLIEGLWWNHHWGVLTMTTQEKRGDSSSFCFIFGGRGGGGGWLPQHWLTLVHLKSSMLNRNCLSFFLLFLEKKSFPPLFFHHHNNRWNRCSPCTPYIPFYKTLWSYNSVSNHCRKLHFGN